VTGEPGLHPLLARRWSPLVFDPAGDVTLVLALNGFSTALTGREVDALGHRLVQAATTVSKALA